jgi:tetratricopeptide (TPR) repeat protein
MPMLQYLQSLAVLAAWDRQHEQAIGYLQEAAQLATEMGLPGELWHIQVRLATLYHTSGQQEPAYAAFKEAQSMLQRLADDIADETLRARFLAAPSSVQHVWQCIQEMASQATPGVKSLDSFGFPV